MTTINGININDQALSTIAEKYGIKLILLFGSFAVGKIHFSSDVDIAVRFSDADVDFNTYLDLDMELQEIFPGREVDMSVLNHADPLFLKKIVETAVVIYGEPGDLSELKIYAYKRYIDHQKYLQMEKEYVKRFIARCKGAA